MGVVSRDLPISLFYSRTIRPHGQEEPERLSGMTACQMEMDRIERLAHPAPDLEEPQAECAQLEMWLVEPCQPAPDGVE